MLNFTSDGFQHTQSSIGMYHQYCDVNIGLFVYLKPLNQPHSSINSVEKSTFGETATFPSVPMINSKTLLVSWSIYFTQTDTKPLFSS